MPRDCHVGRLPVCPVRSVSQYDRHLSCLCYANVYSCNWIAGTINFKNESQLYIFLSSLNLCISIGRTSPLPCLAPPPWGRGLNAQKVRLTCNHLKCLDVFLLAWAKDALLSPSITKHLFLVNGPFTPVSSALLRWFSLSEMPIQRGNNLTFHLRSHSTVIYPVISVLELQERSRCLLCTPWLFAPVPSLWYVFRFLQRNPGWWGLCLF